MNITITKVNDTKPFEPSKVFVITELHENSVEMEFGQLYDADGEDGFNDEAHSSRISIFDEPLLAAMRKIFAGNNKIVFIADPYEDYQKDLRIGG